MRHSHSHVHSKNMHERTHGPARAHALTCNIPTRTCATPRSTYTRHSTFENRQPSPHTHVHSKNLHARTHGRAHSHARTHEIRHVHGDTHTARTHNIRTRANVQRRGAFAYSAFDVRKRTTSRHTPALPHFSNLPSKTAHVFPSRRN